MARQRMQWPLHLVVGIVAWVIHLPQRARTLVSVLAIRFILDKKIEQIAFTFHTLQQHPIATSKTEVIKM